MIDKATFQAAVLKAVTEYADKPVEMDATLGDLGLDSIDIVEILIALEEEFGIDLYEEDLTQDSTLAQLVAELTKQAVK